MTANNIDDKIIDFVVREAGFKHHQISLQSDLRNLGIDGDDAIELMNKFSQEFSVDMSKFDFKRHFSPEGFNPFLILFPSWWRRKLQSITIRDLVKAAETGVWPFE